MKVIATEYLRINLDTERWECRRCEIELGSARTNYKPYMRVRARDPREVHKPLLDPQLYRYTYSPDHNAIAILEYYCPGCGVMAEVEYTVPGHPPLNDLEFDIDKLKQQWASRTELSEPVGSGRAPMDIPIGLRS